MRSFSDLPEGIIIEVLVRLPVKSVLICKAVCKPWLSTISNSHFAKHQLQRAINNPSTLLVIKGHALEGEKGGTIRTLDMSPIQVDSLVMPSVFSAFLVVGSCNGIVCLDNIADSAICLWNPSIRQFKRIHAPFCCKFRIYKLGFGFDSISNDYKVVGVVYENWTAVIPDVFVYSANADSWRHFQDPVLEDLKILRGCSVVVKGVVYFYNRDEIISFDLHKEVFRLVRIPRFTLQNMCNILDFEGSVALLFESEGNGPGDDLWTLDNASHQVSWSKKCSSDLIRLEYRWPLYRWSTYTDCYFGAGLFWGIRGVIGDHIFHYVLYNSETREAKDYGLREDSVHATLKYMETLVTLDGFQQVE